MPNYQKIKEVSKVALPRGKALEKIILDTMKSISDLVGGTLGPSGRPVLIERQEFGLPPIVTKDGVTVFKSLGFENPIAQCVMEAARDASVKTAVEAGDGTTTATILAESIVRNVDKYCRNHPAESPQKVLRILEKAFSEIIKPSIENLSIKADMSTPEGVKLLTAVAKVSANGDEPLAEAVMKCYEISGDDGNVTLSENSGPSAYEVEHISGFGIGMGYEDSCKSFSSLFLNDPQNGRVFMENPVFCLYNGKISEVQTVFGILNLVGGAWLNGVEHQKEDKDGNLTSERRPFTHNLVIVCHGFSDNVLGSLAACFADNSAINPFPLLTPVTPQREGQLNLLEDLAAITGAKVFDPINKPLDQVSDLSDFGTGIKSFEATRYRSTVVGNSFQDSENKDQKTIDAENRILNRIGELDAQKKLAASKFDAELFQERIAKLTGGIAKLKIFGSSNGETKEKRDRAEDAVCAVRGAIKSGCLPAGCWMLLWLYEKLLEFSDPVLLEVLCPALEEPFTKLMTNCGYTDEQMKTIRKPMVDSFEVDENNNLVYEPLVFDALAHKHVSAYESGLLDSTPAVLQAIQNALSIASLLGVLGGAVVFKRDHALETAEGQANADWIKDANVNEANNRP